MKRTSRLVWSRLFLVVAFALVGWVSLCTPHAEAQTGNNAVYDSGGLCSPCQSSPAFIDATVFITSPPPLSRNFCGVLNYILNPLNGKIPSFGAVIDARGLNSVNTSMTCTTTNPSPWYGISSPPPSTILLPATTPTNPIKIPSVWALPPNTHLIGEGDTISSTTTISTTIQAKSSFSSSSMIQFGTPSCIPPLGGPSTCTGISVEKLTLDGQGQAIIGHSAQCAAGLAGGVSG
jgi:hypothetical protein